MAKILLLSKMFLATKLVNFILGVGKILYFIFPSTEHVTFKSLQIKFSIFDLSNLWNIGKPK